MSEYHADCIPWSCSFLGGFVRLLIAGNVHMARYLYQWDFNARLPPLQWFECVNYWGQYRWSKLLTWLCGSLYCRSTIYVNDTFLVTLSGRLDNVHCRFDGCKFCRIHIMRSVPIYYWWVSDVVGQKAAALIWLSIPRFIRVDVYDVGILDCFIMTLLRFLLVAADVDGGNWSPPGPTTDHNARNRSGVSKSRCVCSCGNSPGSQFTEPIHDTN